MTRLLTSPTTCRRLAPSGTLSTMRCTWDKTIVFWSRARASTGAGTSTTTFAKSFRTNHHGVGQVGSRTSVSQLLLFFTPTVMLDESCVLISGVVRARCSSVSHGSTQGQYTEMDISTTALQFIDFLKRKPDYESLNNEVDRAYTPGECDIVLCDDATMYFSSAACPIDSMRMHAGATQSVIVFSVETSRAKSTSGFSVSTWRRSMS